MFYMIADILCIFDEAYGVDIYVCGLYRQKSTAQYLSAGIWETFLNNAFCVQTPFELFRELNNLLKPIT